MKFLVELKLEEEVFSQLASEYRNKLLVYAYRMVGNIEDARDIVQDTLLKAYISRAQFANGTNVRAWFYKITHNVALNYIQDKKTEKRVYEKIGNRQSKIQYDDIQVEHSELKNMMQKEIGKLPAQYREVVILRFMQHLKYEEVAEVLDIPLNTVKVYIARGLNILRKRLKPILKKDFAYEM